MSDSRLEQGKDITLVGLITNSLLAMIKMITGVLGHSHALIADAVESFADIFSSLVVWRAVVVAAVPPDDDHPYGHGKAEPIAAAVVAAMLLATAIWIGVSSVIEILHPNESPRGFTLIVLVVVIIIKEALYRRTLLTAHQLENSAIHADAWHHRADAITSLTAGIGISVALVGGPKFGAADEIAAIIAALVIAWNGYSLLRPAVNELMDASPPAGLRQQVCSVSESRDHVRRVEKCFLRKVGNRYFVDMHIEVSPSMTVLAAHEVAHDVKDAVRSALPSVADVLVHIEPDRSPEKPKL